MNPSELACMTVELKSHALYTIFISLFLQKIKQKTKKIFLLRKKKVRSCFHGADGTAGHPNSHVGLIRDSAQTL